MTHYREYTRSLNGKILWGCVTIAIVGLLALLPDDSRVLRGLEPQFLSNAAKVADPGNREAKAQRPDWAHLENEMQNLQERMGLLETEVAALKHQGLARAGKRNYSR